MVYHHFWKNVFLTHFSPIFGLETAHFQGILGFSMAQNAPPRAQNGLKNLFEHPKWPRNNFEKNNFFRLGNHGGHTVGPNRVPPVLPTGSTK